MKNNEHKKDLSIIIVDENANYRNQIAGRLRLKGFYVEVATGGFHLLHILEKEGKTYDLVIMHNNMNDMTAYEMTCLIRNFRTKKELPILYLSKNTSKEDLEELVRAGVTDVFQKITEQHRITEKVQNILLPKKSTAAS